MPDRKSNNQSPQSTSNIDADNDASVQSSSIKRKYITLSIYQEKILRDAFAITEYPSRSNIEQLASLLNLPIKRVSTWFVNRRSLNRRKIAKEQNSQIIMD